MPSTSGLDAIEDAVDLLVGGEDGSDGAFGSFSAGIAQGELEPVLDIEEGSTVALCWGPALVRAFWLARIAREGEALADPNLEALRSGALLTRGKRIGRLGEERVRGHRIDLAHPWRSALGDSVSRLRTPELVSRSSLIAEMMVRAGSLGIVRAERGAGGTRFLEELSASFEHARVLVITPHPVGEPLGCLRRALDRERAAARGPIVLPGDTADHLDRLLEGRGLDIDQSAELLSSWLAPESDSAASGAVLVDDVCDVDGDTLEAIARGALTGAEPYRVVVRLGPRADLPEALDELPEGPEVRLSPLAKGAAADVASALVDGALDDAAANRWGKRGGGLPLAIREALAESLQSGELVWVGGNATPRVRIGGRGRAQPARHWILKRLGYLDPAARAVVTALAVLGGEAEVPDVEELVHRVANVPVDLADSQNELARAGWLRLVKPDLVSLVGATHRDVLVEALPASELAAWHRAAAMVVAATERPLARASAASQAALAGDMRRASRFALDAAKAAREAGLAETALALESFARSEDPAAMMRRLSASMFPTGSVFPQAPSASGHSVGPSVMPPEGWTVASRSRSSYPPLELPGGMGDGPADAQAVPKAPRIPGGDLVALAAREESERPGSVAPVTDEDIESLPPSDIEELGKRPSSVRADAEEIESLSPSELKDASPSAPAGPDGGARERLSELELSDSVMAPDPSSASEPKADESGRRSKPAIDRAEAIAESQPEPSVPQMAQAVEALRRGRPDDVDALVAELRGKGGHDRLAERLEAMASLARGQTGGALRVLRSAADRARGATPADRCRAALAHAVGLAAAGRSRDALLEALEGLARAREAGDPRGEQACLRFLAQVCESAGDAESAKAWRAAGGE